MDRTANYAPLNSFPLIRTRNIEEIRQTFVQGYGARQINLPRETTGPELRFNYWQSQNIALSHFSFNGPFQLEFPTGSFFRQAFVRGEVDIRFGRVKKKAANAETCVLPPDAMVAATYAPSVEHFGFKIKTDSLLRKLAALIGATPSRKLVFDQATRIDGSALDHFRRMLTFFAAEVDLIGRSNSLPPPIIELEQALIASFICSYPHNYTALLHARIRPAASWQVRRAEEYIAAHWNQPITMDDLARESATSARTLFHQFRRNRGQSPMAFVKDIRLQRAHEMLERLDFNTSITQVAVTCGFGNLGHFARDYCKRFGERPSDTVKRNKNLQRAAVPSLTVDRSKL